MRQLLLLFIIALFYTFGNCTTYTIGTTGDFATLDAAESTVQSGDTLLVLNGMITNDRQYLDDLHGTISDPIVIIAQTMHGFTFQGDVEAIHLTNCSHLEINGFIIEGQTGNGVNIDDGGDYSAPTHHIAVRNCIFRDMAANGNNDLLKLSGLDDFLIENCQFLNGGSGGSGIDMVGCHRGVIQSNYFDQAGSSGIQAKGGTQFIRIQRNFFKDMDQRALNLGGSTGLQFFRPPLSEVVDSFEAADLDVYSNIFVGTHAPIAYVGSQRVKVYNNTIYHPENWVIRILQETTTSGFLPCANNEFRNNIIVLPNDLTEVNIGPNTLPGTFIFTNNLWHNESSSGAWTPGLPVVDSNQIIADPAFIDPAMEDFHIPDSSMAMGNGKSLIDPVTDYDNQPFFSPRSIGAFEVKGFSTLIYEFQNEHISIFPNPSNHIVTITGDFTNATIQILNNTGQVVTDYSNAASPVDIDINQLPSGLYFVHIQHNTNSALSVTNILKY